MIIDTHSSHDDTEEGNSEVDSSCSPLQTPASYPTVWEFAWNDPLREAILDLHLKKRLWRRPKLHWDSTLPVHLGTDRHPEVHARLEAHRGETWYELFYDLVFVAGALQVRNFIELSTVC
jgi:hypothetical protein